MLVLKVDWLGEFGMFRLLWEMFEKPLAAACLPHENQEIHQQKESKLLLVKDNSLVRIMKEAS